MWVLLTKIHFRIISHHISAPKKFVKIFFSHFALTPGWSESKFENHSALLNISTQIKRINELENDTVNTYTIFEDLHSNEFLSPTQRQLSYRIFFGLTPTSEGLAKRHNRIFPWKICSGDQETEEHIFFLCPFIQDIKLDLIKMLRQPHNTLFDIYKAIFLNHLPQQTCETISKLKILLIHVYKETIWKIRNLATHQNQIFCKRTIQTKYPMVK